MAKAYLPLYVNLRGKRVLVVGFGAVGKRRVKELWKAGANITVIDKNRLKGKGPNFIQKKLSTKSIPPLKNYFLVVAATDDKRLNAAIAEKAAREHVLINRADDFRGGNVVFPAIVRTRKNVVSITTFGKDPKLSKEIKRVLHGVSKR